jgi:hypothetical protein
MTWQWPPHDKTARVSLPLPVKPLMHHGGPPFMTSSNPNYFPKALSDNTINMNLGMKFPTHDLLGAMFKLQQMWK